MMLLLNAISSFLFALRFSVIMSTSAAFAVLYYVGVAIYNAYLHPLRHIPGPKTAAASRLVWARHQRNGTLVKYLTKLHEEYGEVVRLAPNEISFISGETAWQDIYGLRVAQGDHGAYLKDHYWFPLPINGVQSIVVADEADHARQRRLLAHAFTEKALSSQEHIIQFYVDLLIQRLHEQIQGEAKGVVDMTRWYSYITFDVIADLTFGESFHCLRDKDYHPWVSMAFQSLKAFGPISIKRHFPIWGRILKLFETQAAVEFRREFFRFGERKIAWRMSTEMTRPDFMGFITRHQDEKGLGMTIKEIQSSVNSFMIAGTETSATMLTGTTMMLIQHPDKMNKLINEIRGKFGKHTDITLEEVSNLPYLDAVFHEGLRMYPPVPTGFARVVPPGGDTISGHWVPGKTSVYVSQFPANHSSRNFTEPDSFIPERWLGEDERFAKDKTSVWNPFSFGPRNCIGKNLATAEIRLVMAKMFWNFDMELHPDTQKDWFNQKVFTLWEKPPLYIQLKRAG